MVSHRAILGPNAARQLTEKQFLKRVIECIERTAEE
jgi:hypothetical protein